MRVPRPSAPPLVGHTRDLLRRGFLACAEDYRAACGDVFEINVALRRLIVVCRPEHAYHILVQHAKSYDKGSGYRLMSSLLGEGLLTIPNGQAWRQNRRVCQPAFARKELQGLIPSMVYEAETLAARWKQLRDTGTTLNMSDEMLAVTMKIVGRCLFGSDVEAFCASTASSLDELYKLGIERFFNPLRPPLWVPIKTHRVFLGLARLVDDLIADFIQKRKHGRELEDDLLGRLMQAVQEPGATGCPVGALSDRQLRDECMTFFVAGHETTATAMSWTWYLLSQHPAVLDKLIKEVFAVVGDRPVTAADLPRLAYTDAVIRESMRLYPPVWIVGRSPIHDDVLGGYTIPKGADLMVLITAIHRHPEFWPEPDRFLPERFMSDVERPACAYMPFGVGPRICIGKEFAEQEMKILLATLVRAARPVRADAAPVEPEAQFTLRLRDPLPMTLVTPARELASRPARTGYDA
jgi:cytochrome P450